MVLTFAAGNSVVAAQAPSGSLTVTVRDETGAVLRGVLVKVNGPGIERSIAVDLEGRAMFQSLPPGRYALTATREGFTSVSLADIMVGVAEPLTLSVTLHVSAVAENVNIIESGYRTPSASVGTKMNTELFDTPVFVNIVPGVVLQESKAVTLQDSLQFVAGITPSVLGRNDNFLTIRGFSTSGVVMKDGLSAVTDWSFPTRYDMFNVERVEVLKGPSSVLNGRASPGGALNLVTKQPQARPAFSVEQRLGSFNLKRTSADATGPLNKTKSLLYRVNVVHDDSDTYRDFNVQQRTGFDGSLLWKIGPATDVKVNGQRLSVKFQSEDGVFVSGSQIIDVPANRSSLDPRSPADEIKESHVGLEVTHKFNATWTVLDRFGTTRRESQQDNMGIINGSSAPFRADGVTIDRSMNAQWSNTVLYSNNLELQGTFTALGTRHQVLVGFDYLNDFTKYSLTSAFTALAASQAAGLQLNVFNPAYGGFDASLYTQLRDTQFNSTMSRSVFRTDSSGVYGQDLMTYRNNWHILVGGRWDDATSDRGSAVTNGLDFGPAKAAFNADGLRNDTHFSPRLGLVYQPVTWLGLFSNYTTGFHSNQALSTTQIFPPQTTKQVEGGLKAELWHNRISTTMTVFDLRKQNIRIVDPATPVAPFNYLLIGEQRSKGVEWVLSGSIASGLNIIGNYTHIPRAWVSQDRTVAQGGSLGLPLAGVNREQGSVWLSYTLPVETAGSWNLGGGAFFVYDRQGDQTSSFTVPGYTRWDAFAGYRFRSGKWTAQLNIQNLLNTKYYTAAGSRTSVIPGSPRAAILSLGVGF